MFAERFSILFAVLVLGGGTVRADAALTKHPAEPGTDRSDNRHRRP